MSEAKKIVSDLLDWAKDEMKLGSGEKYRSSLSHQSELVQNSSLKKLWSHLTENVKSEETVERIRDTLKLNDLTQEEKDLEASCSETQNHLSCLENDIQNLEAQLEACRNSCLQSNLKICELQQASQLCDDKTVLCKAHSLKRANHLSSIDTVTDSLQEQKTKMQNRNLALDKSSTHSLCTTHVKKLVSDIAGRYAGGLNTTQSMDCMELWRGVLDILDKYTGDTVLKVLKTITKEDIDKVIKCEKNSCPEKEMSAIEHSLCFEDSTAGQNPASTIKKMLETHDLESAQEFIGIKEKKEMAEVKSKQNEEMKIQLQNMIKAKLPEMHEQQTALETLDAEIELSSLSAKLESLQFSANELQKDFDLKESDDKHIQSVLKEIKNFSTELMESKQQMLAAVEQNLQFRSSLQSQQAEALAKVHSSMSGASSELQQAKTDLQELLSEEISSFQHADLSQMAKLPVGKKNVPLSDLLINRSEKVDHNSGGTAYNKVSSSLNAPHMSCPSDLLRKVQECKTQSGYQESVTTPIRLGEVESHNCASNLSKLHAQAEEFSRTQRCELLPQIAKGTKVVEAFDKETEKLEKALEEWWEEPAQNSVPWLKFNGLALSDLKENAKLQHHSESASEF